MHSVANNKNMLGTYDQKVVVAIKWLLLGWVTVCGQVNHLGI